MSRNRLRVGYINRLCNRYSHNIKRRFNGCTNGCTNMVM
jgi:hypothetical protein